MNANQQITYLSKTEEVSMGDAWFEHATIDHFWIKRRFEVLSKLVSDVGSNNLVIGEIGSGSGVVQRQFEMEYNRAVDGFDLNEYALKRSIAEISPTYCYNIHDRNPSFKEKYDVILLFDVIEHIEDAKGFLESCLFHLKDGGRLIINVPAKKYLMSNYDIAAGHVMRYLPSDFKLLEEKLSLKTVSWTYWGFLFIPMLLVRKMLIAGEKDKDKILTSGFSKKSNLVNKILGFLGSIEIIPQHFTGTSLMWVFKKN
jgi:SAM-dependent methyltransferase